MKIVYNIDNVDYAYYITPTEVEEMEKSRNRISIIMPREQFMKIWFAKQAFEALRRGDLHKNE